MPVIRSSIFDPSEEMKRAATPLGWGDDLLSAHMEAALRNRHATFANQAQWIARLRGIDDCFLAIAREWNDPTNYLSAFLLIRAHSAFRAVCDLVTAGATAEAFPVLRCCLEYAAYALHIDRNPELGPVWLARDEGADALAAVRSKFRYEKIVRTVQATDPKCSATFEMLYERALEFGAHPNVRAIAANAVISSEDGRRIVRHTYLHASGLQLEHALSSVAEAGLCVLEILQHAFTARFQETGADALLGELRVRHPTS